MKKLISVSIAKFYVMILTSLFVGEIQSQDIPQIFIEGVISTGDYDTHPAFSPTGDTLFFVKCSPDFSSWTIYVSYKINEGWTEPQIAEFSGYMDADPFFSHDGKTLFFVSGRPDDPGDTSKTDLNIWKVEKTENGWSEPVCLDAPINSDKDEYYPSITKDGTIYFGSDREGGFGSCDIYRCKLINGKYGQAENLGDAVNTPDNEYEPFISPDEKFLIFMATRPQGLANGDLYISYYENGKWTKAEKLPEPINSSAIEFSPKITWDSKHFVFSSTRNTYTRNHSKPETTREFNNRIRNAGNGLGDIYIIDLYLFNKIVKQE